MQLQDVNPLELARQMTLMESQLYNRIRPVDCLNKAWSQTDRPEAGANIKAMILTSNRVRCRKTPKVLRSPVCLQIAGWVAEAILVHTDAKKRASVMKHFVQTAGVSRAGLLCVAPCHLRSVRQHCRMMNNFSTMAAIMAGLNSTPIRRLHRTRSLLSAKTMSLFDDLDKTLDSGKNFAGYRERLKRVDPPCIPFLGELFLASLPQYPAHDLPARCLLDLPDLHRGWQCKFPTGTVSWNTLIDAVNVCIQPVPPPASPGILAIKVVSDRGTNSGAATAHPFLQASKGCRRHPRDPAVPSHPLCANGTACGAKLHLGEVAECRGWAGSVRDQSAAGTEGTRGRKDVSRLRREDERR